MLPYIIQVILFQILFLAIYDLFLSKETFFSKNRFYLLFTSIVSFIIPLIKLPTVQNAVPVKYGVLLPEVVLSPETIIEDQEWYQSINYFGIIFWLGVSFFSVLFIIKLYTILQLIYKSPIEKKKTHSIVLLPENSKAFSFFNFIFLGENIDNEKREKVIEHELVHCKQRHTIDLLLFEFLKIIMWFNPMVWLYQKRISLVHEFISDEIVSKSSEKNKYINNLLAEAFQVEQISFVNQFYKKSLVKKRIMMMTKKQSNKILQLKYVLLLPIITSMLIYTSCSNTDETGAVISNIDRYNEGNLITVLWSKEIPKTKEYSVEDLTEAERKEYNVAINNETERISFLMKPRIFEGKNGKKILHYNSRESVGMSTKYYNYSQGYGSKYTINEIPLSMAGVFPVYPGCEEGDRDCFNTKIREFVLENFDFNITKKCKTHDCLFDEVYVHFIITKEGKIAKIKADGMSSELKKHAMDIVKKLPQMKPAIKNGKPVAIKYTLPLWFKMK